MVLSVNLIEEDSGEWLAHFIQLPNVSAFGDTPVVGSAPYELETAWEAMKASYKKHGEEIPTSPLRKEYSGQFNVRIYKRIHRALAIEAITPQKIRKFMRIEQTMMLIFKKC